MAVPLTSLSHGAGCGCKLSAADLRPIVAGLARPTDPRVLVATDTADDAGVVAAHRGRWRSCRPSTSSRRSSTTRTRSGGSRPRTRCRTSTRWAATPVSALNLVAYPLETLGPGRAARDPARRRRRGGRGGRLDRRRALDRRPRAQVRPRGHRRGRPARGPDQRRRAGGRRARADQAARRGHDRHRAQARARLAGAGRARRSRS